MHFMSYVRRFVNSSFREINNKILEKKDFTSEKFADFIQKKFNQGGKALVFVIGGAYGFSKEVYDRSDSLLSLSKMTFSHQMIRMIFFEQVYRAMTILKGEPYHHS